METLLGITFLEDNSCKWSSLCHSTPVHPQSLENMSNAFRQLCSGVHCRLKNLTCTQKDEENIHVTFSNFRFVKVTPSSTADESLLLDILCFISKVLKLTNHVPDNILQWVGEVLYHPKGPLIGLLHRQGTREAPEDVTESLVNVRR